MCHRQINNRPNPIVESKNWTKKLESKHMPIPLRPQLNQIQPRDRARNNPSTQTMEQSGLAMFQKRARRKRDICPK